MDDRQLFRPPGGDQGRDIRLGARIVARPPARIVDRLLHIDHDQRRIRRQAHGIRAARRERPVVEVEHDARLVALGLAQRKLGAGAVLGRDRAQPQGPDVVAARQRRRLDHFAPGEHGVAGEERRDMPAAIDGGDMEGVGEAVEGQRAGERDHMAAIDEPAAEPPLPLVSID